MSLVVLVGILSVLAVAAAYLAWLSWPTRRGCPECGGPTVPVASRALPEVIRRRAWARWCPGCGWEGVGRRGPDLSDGPVDHESGFRWSRARPDAPTFLWAPPETGDATPEPAGAEEAPDPSHPSGFRWAPPTTPHARRPDGSPGADGPTGFRWASRDDRS